MPVRRARRLSRDTAPPQNVLQRMTQMDYAVSRDNDKTIARRIATLHCFVLVTTNE